MAGRGVGCKAGARPAFVADPFRAEAAVRSPKRLFQTLPAILPPA
jgi:hypothetical protein